MSGKSKALVNVVDQAVAAFDPPLPLAIAFSGGADSSALLLACHARWPGLVRAIHVHHGLQEAADGFQLHCEHLCAQHAIPLKVCKIDARHEPGQSPEDAARQGRYQALIDATTQSWVDDEGESWSPCAPSRWPSMRTTRWRPCCSRSRVVPVWRGWRPCRFSGRGRDCNGSGLAGGAWPGIERLVGAERGGLGGRPVQ